MPFAPSLLVLVLALALRLAVALVLVLALVLAVALMLAVAGVVRVVFPVTVRPAGRVLMSLLRTNRGGGGHTLEGQAARIALARRARRPVHHDALLVETGAHLARLDLAHEAEGVRLARHGDHYPAVLGVGLGIVTPDVGPGAVRGGPGAVAVVIVSVSAGRAMTVTAVRLVVPRMHLLGWLAVVPVVIVLMGSLPLGRRWCGLRSGLRGGLMSTMIVRLLRQGRSGEREARRHEPTGGRPVHRVDLVLVHVSDLPGADRRRAPCRVPA